jgi:hypothetical protein
MLVTIYQEGHRPVEHPAEFMVMQYERPGGNLLPIAILLLDLFADKLHVRSRDDFDAIADREDAELLQLFIAQLADESEQMSGSDILQELEDKLANSVRITERQLATADDIQRTLADLYREHVDPLGAQRFRKAQTAG